MQLINVQTNRFLESNGAGDVHTYLENGENNQKWRIINDGNGYFYLQNMGTSRFLLSNSNGDISDNPTVGGDYQRWSFSADNIINKATGKYLDSNVNGDVYSLTASGGNTQRWRTIYLGKTDINYKI